MRQLIKNIIFILTVLLLFAGHISSKESLEHIEIYDNGTLILKLSKSIDTNLKDYINTGVPFEATINLKLNKEGFWFILSDKIIKEYIASFKFSYNIIYKKYTLQNNEKSLSFEDYKSFVATLGNISINSFIPKESIISPKNYYIELVVDYHPEKGNIEMNSINMLPKNSTYKIERKLYLQDIIWKN